MQTTNREIFIERLHYLNDVMESLERKKKIANLSALEILNIYQGFEGQLVDSQYRNVFIFTYFMTMIRCLLI